MNGAQNYHDPPKVNIIIVFESIIQEKIEFLIYNYIIIL